MKNPKIAVVALIEKNEKILIGKKKKGNSLLSGDWHIPWGKLFSWEKEEEALRREIQEETWLDIQIKKSFWEFFSSSSDIIIKWYLCYPIWGDLISWSDLEDVKFVSKQEVFSYCSYKVLNLFPETVREYLKN